MITRLQHQELGFNEARLCNAPSVHKRESLFHCRPQNPPLVEMLWFSRLLRREKNGAPLVESWDKEIHITSPLQLSWQRAPLQRSWARGRVKTVRWKQMCWRCIGRESRHCNLEYLNMKAPRGERSGDCLITPLYLQKHFFPWTCDLWPGRNAEYGT